MPPEPTKEKNRLRNATDDSFISEYYKSSRLHHLSLWRAQFEDELNAFVMSLNPEMEHRGKPASNNLPTRKINPDDVTSPLSYSDDEQDSENTHSHSRDKREDSSTVRVIMHVDMV